MSLLRILSLTALLLIGMFVVPQESNASTSFGFFIGHHRPYYHYYHYRPYFYHRPYFGGFYNPYYYGGFGYPYSYHRGYFVGEIRTEVKPQEARVYVDGDYAGVADDFDGWWQRLEVEPGKHRLVFRAPGYQPYAVNIRVLPGRDAHIKYEMRPGQDQITEDDMRLPREDYSRRRDYKDRDYRDRDYKDRDYRDRYERRRSERYRDRDKDRDYDREEEDYWAREHKREDRDDDLSYQRETDRKSLVLKVEPSDATVYIDGNYYGTANDNGRGEIEVLLPEGVHRVEVVRPGYSSYSQEVTVRKDGENRISIILQKK